MIVLIINFSINEVYIHIRIVNADIKKKRFVVRENTNVLECKNEVGNVACITAELQCYGAVGWLGQRGG